MVVSVGVAVGFLAFWVFISYVAPVWLVSNWKVAVVAQSVVILPALLILLGVAWDLANAAVTVASAKSWPSQKQPHAKKA